VIHPKKLKTLTWHFKAPQVHDFAWAADPDFLHDKVMGEKDVELHFIYKKDPEIIEKWKALQPKTQELLAFFNKNIGQYPYKQYTVIQGGDGGMEYAMCTLITGKRSMPSLVGVTAHELAHSWFQQVLATNESKHEWMDEGFTTFISEYAMYEIMKNKNYKTLYDAFQSSYTGYNRMVASGKEQPQSTHADRYDLNSVYGTSSYSKGLIFLAQLGYIIGWDNMMKTLKRYYANYKFTHPTPNDFKRTAERVSGAVLDWYLVDWTQTTNTIDYAIKTVEENNNQTEITLERKGRTPMPIEVLITYQDNTQEQIYIPNPLMRWHKENPNPSLKWTVLNGWGWAYPTYSLVIEKPKKDIKKIEIDASGYMADVNRSNNVWE
jgi:aminopeptidase N